MPPSEASSVFVSAPGPSSERGNFLQSHSMHVRMLSSLIILKTLTQGLTHVMSYRQALHLSATCHVVVGCLN